MKPLAGVGRTRRAAELHQALLLEQADHLPNRLEGDIQLDGDIGDAAPAIAALHDLEQAPVAFRVLPVIDPNANARAEHLAFEAVDYILVSLPGLDPGEA